MTAPAGTGAWRRTLAEGRRRAYPAVVEGRIVWIVDGYTTSNSYPNSERVNLNEVTSDAQTSAGGAVVAQPQDDVNYMRNSVKAVVDAYDGSVKLATPGTKPIRC